MTPPAPPLALLPRQGYDIYRYAASIPGRDADPQPIIFAYISLNLQTLSQSGLIAPAPDSSAAGAAPPTGPAAGLAPEASGGSSGSGEGGAAAPTAASSAAVRAAVAAAMSDQQKAELKGRLKDIMSRLMHRDQSAGAMQELYVLRRWVGHLESEHCAGCRRPVKQPDRQGAGPCGPADSGPAMLPTGTVSVGGCLSRAEACSPEAKPATPPCREYPSFVERYIENTSDMFKNFIENGLAALEAKSALKLSDCLLAASDTAQTLSGVPVGNAVAKARMEPSANLAHTRAGLVSCPHA